MGRLRLSVSYPAGAPGIGHLLDCTANVYRPGETLGVARETIRTYAVIYSDIACTMLRKDALLTTVEDGLIETGQRTVYFDRGITLLERDVIRVRTGPHAPVKLEVESVAYPRGHHWEAKVTEFHGILPDD